MFAFSAASFMMICKPGFGGKIKPSISLAIKDVVEVIGYLDEFAFSVL